MSNSKPSQPCSRARSKDTRVFSGIGVDERAPRWPSSRGRSDIERNLTLDCAAARTQKFHPVKIHKTLQSTGLLHELETFRFPKIVSPDQNREWVCQCREIPWPF